MAESNDQPLVVHHLNNSRSQRILWLLEELEVPYEIKKYHRTATHRAPKELFALHPLAKSPVITHEDVILAESGAIVEYIIDRYGRNKVHVPEAGKIDNLYFTHYAEGSFMPLLIQHMINTIVPKQSPLLLRPLARKLFGQVDGLFVEPEVNRHVDMIEAHLEKNGGCFAGGSKDNITSADYMMLFALEAFAAQNPGRGPNIQEYIARMHARPAYLRALRKGGRYVYGPKM